MSVWSRFLEITGLDRNASARRFSTVSRCRAWSLAVELIVCKGCFNGPFAACCTDVASPAHAGVFASVSTLSGCNTYTYDDHMTCS